MPLYEVSLYLAGGATTKIKLQADEPKQLINNIDEQLKGEQLRLGSQSERAILIIKKPTENIVGYLIDEI